MCGCGCCFGVFLLFLFFVMLNFSSKKEGTPKKAEWKELEFEEGNPKRRKVRGCAFLRCCFQSLGVYIRFLNFLALHNLPPLVLPVALHRTCVVYLSLHSQVFQAPPSTDSCSNLITAAVVTPAHVFNEADGMHVRPRLNASNSVDETHLRQEGTLFILVLCWLMFCYIYMFSCSKCFIFLLFYFLLSSVDPPSLFSYLPKPFFFFFRWKALIIPPPRTHT